jgi:hypothetical protein
MVARHETGPGGVPRMSPRRSESRPSVGVYLALILALFLLIFTLFFIPVSGRFPRAAAAGDPAMLTRPRCVALSYRSEVDMPWLPFALELQPRRSPHWRDEEHLYEAVWYRRSRDGRVWARDAAWRFAGVDSVDVGGHHTPLVRLSIREQPSRGRVGWPDFPSVVDAFTSRDHPVGVREVDCGDVAAESS